MTLEQINEFINKGYAALGLFTVAFILVLTYFRRSLAKK